MSRLRTATARSGGRGRNQVPEARWSDRRHDHFRRVRTLLSSVVADALKGKITWKRWEQDAGAKLAVFDIEVPDEKSNYYVKFCCVPNGYMSTGQADLKVFNERASYHGEIGFNPADGSILRLTIQAEMPPKGLVPNAASPSNTALWRSEAKVISAPQKASLSIRRISPCNRA